MFPMEPCIWRLGCLSLGPVAFRTRLAAGVAFSDKTFISSYLDLMSTNIYVKIVQIISTLFQDVIVWPPGSFLTHKNLSSMLRAEKRRRVLRTEYYPDESACYQPITNHYNHRNHGHCHGSLHARPPRYLPCQG